MIIHRCLGRGAIVLLLLSIACASTSTVQRKKEAEAARNLGEAYFQKREFPLALSALLKAESLNPDDPYLHNDLGLVYFYIQKYDEAIHHYKKALDLKSDYAPAMNNLANAYMAQKKWDSAIEYYSKAIANPLYVTPHYSLSNLGVVYYEKREYGLSEKYFQQALDIRSDFVPALQGIAKTYIALGRIPEAVSKLEKSLRLQPDSEALHFELARAYQLSGENQKAIDFYKRAIQIAPESAIADEARVALQRLE